MKLVHVSHISGDLYALREFQAADPGYGHGGGFHPDNSLPGGGHISNTLPGGAGHPDNRPPSGPPVQVGPGEVLVMVRDQAGVWHYAAIQPGSPPPKPLPVPPPNRPGQGLPPTAGPKA